MLSIQHLPHCVLSSVCFNFQVVSPGAFHALRAANHSRDIDNRNRRLREPCLPSDIRINDVKESTTTMTMTLTATTVTSVRSRGLANSDAATTASSAWGQLE